MKNMGGGRMEIFMRVFSATILLLSFCTGLLAEEGKSEDVTFKEISSWRKWKQYNEPIEKGKVQFILEKDNVKDGKQCLKITVVEDGTMYGVEQEIKFEKAGLVPSKGKLSGYIKSEANTLSESVGMTAQCFNANGYGDIKGAKLLEKEQNGWQKFEAKFEIPSGTEGIFVNCVIRGKGEACFDDLKLFLKENDSGQWKECALFKNGSFEDAAGASEISPETKTVSSTNVIPEPEKKTDIPIAWVDVTDKDLEGPGIAYSTAMNKAVGPSGESVWVVPLPEQRKGQWPFYFKFYSDKLDMIKSDRIYERAPGHWMLEVTIKPLKKGEEVNWGWGAYSLLGAKDYSKCPKDAKVCAPDKYPAEIREYLKSSKALQVEHPEIKAKADELKKGTDNVLEIAERIYKFMDEERPRGGSPNSGDALESLRKNGGSCTNHAILTAALFRACGIPARVLACYPTWFHGSLATHYDVEYYVPGFGWKQMDTISARKEVQPYEHVVVSSVMIADEDNGMDEARYGMWLGVPRYTLRERVKGEAEGDEGNETFGFATAGGIKEFKGDIFEASGLAKAVWEKFLKLKKNGKENLQAETFQLAAAKSQNPKEFTDSLTKALKIYNGEAVKEEPVSANFTDKVLLSVSANQGHGWGSTALPEFYEKYVFSPLRKKLGERLVTTCENSTLMNIQKILREQNPSIFVWIGGGLNDTIELNKTVGENVDFVNVKPAAELDLKGRIAFINCEFAPDINKTLKDCKAAFGYWTEMSTSMHQASYNCDYFPDEPQPLDWYAPYFINMRKVIEDVASGTTVKEAAAKADARWKGFLEWINKHPEIPFRNDYLELKMDWSELSGTVFGNGNVKVEK